MPVPTRELAVADLDGDGVLDAVAGGASRVDVLLGNGDGTFVLTQQILAGLGGPTDLVLGNMNGDSHPDLVFLQESVRRRSFRGNGDGTFTLATGDNSDRTRLSAADLDGDGLLDIVEHNLNAFSFEVLRGDGTGRFRSWQTLGTSIRPWEILAADADGDGVLDLIAFGDGGASFFRGRGDGFDGEVIIDGDRPGQYGVTGDFNGDGALDFATTGSIGATASYLLSIFMGDGTGGFPAIRSTPVSAAAGGIVSADFNEEGTADLVIGASLSGPFALAVALNPVDGSGHFPVGTALGRTLVAQNNDFLNFATGDFNRDGRLDVATVDGSEVVIYLRTDETSVLDYRRGSVIARECRLVAAADFNGDGREDIAVSANRFVYVYLGDGQGGFEQAGSKLMPAEPTSIQPGHFNNRDDEYLDLLVGMRAYPGVQPLFGRGDGTFDFALATTFSPGPDDMEVGDIDEDGNLDLATEDGLVRFGDGHGRFEVALAMSVSGPQNRRVELADVDRDGHLDLIHIAGGPPQRTVFVWLGDGRRRFRGPFISGVPFDPKGGVVADVSGDGVPDLILGDFRYLYQANGDGRGRFEPVRLFGTGSFRMRLAAPDLDGDGRADLVVGGDACLALHRNLSRQRSCVLGTVNARGGATTDVLLVNGSAGSGEARTVSLAPTDPLDVFMTAPPAGPSTASFALWAWLDVPSPETTRVVPLHIGVLCQPTAFTELDSSVFSDPFPGSLRVTWNNTGFARLGRPDLPSRPAPSRILRRPNGVGVPVTFFLQGIIADSGSRSSLGASVTNGVTVVVR